MDKQQVSGLYIDTAAPSTTIPHLCRSGYYCLVLTSSNPESDTKYGLLHYDYCDGVLVAYRADSACTEIPASCQWMVAFKSDLFIGLLQEKQVEEYSFWEYAPYEALHVSQKESQMLTSCFNDIRNEYNQHTNAVQIEYSVEAHCTPIELYNTFLRPAVHNTRNGKRSADTTVRSSCQAIY